MKFIGAIFFMLCYQTVFCQWGINIHGGYANTSVLNHETYNQPNNSYIVGLAGVYQFKNNIAVVAELNYERKAAQGTINYHNIIGDKVLSYNKQLQLHYITVPLMARYSLGSKGIYAFVDAGLYYGWLAGAWVNPQDIGISHDVSKDFKPNDIGFAGAFGMHFFINNTYSISLEWRNHSGLTNISTQANNQYNRSNLFQLSAYYHLQVEE